MMIAVAMAASYQGKTAALKAEDDFQLVKVADGVYAAIAKSIETALSASILS